MSEEFWFSVKILQTQLKPGVLRFIYFRVSCHNFQLLNNDAKEVLLEFLFWKRVHSGITETQVEKLEIWTLFQARFLTHDESCILFLNLSI